jgi:hypothetical protein
MPRVTNTYVVPFEPVRNGPEEFSFAKDRFNVQRFVKKRGSRTTPYPSFVDVYQRSERCSVESDTFEDLQLHDSSPYANSYAPRRQSHDLIVF